MNYSSIILPTDMKKQYLLCFIKHYLENCECETFTAKEIADAILDFYTSNKESDFAKNSAIEKSKFSWNSLIVGIESLILK